MSGSLKERRVKLGFTLRDVEAITKGRISNAYLSQVENGRIKNPSLSFACEIAACYGTTVEEIQNMLGISTNLHSPSICPACGQAVRT